MKTSKSSRSRQSRQSVEIAGHWYTDGRGLRLRRATPGAARVRKLRRIEDAARLARLEAGGPLGAAAVAAVRKMRRAR